MSHWDKFQRFYTGLLIFVSVNAAAAVAVFDGVDFSKETKATFAFNCVKCIALASVNLLTYIQSSKKPQPPTP